MGVGRGRHTDTRLAASDNLHNEQNNSPGINFTAAARCRGVEVSVEGRRPSAPPTPHGGLMGAGVEGAGGQRAWADRLTDLYCQPDTL